MAKYNLMKKYFGRPENRKPSSCLEVASIVCGIIIFIITGFWLMMMIYISIQIDEFPNKVKTTAFWSIAFAFSIILLVGLIQKRPGCVIVYLVFGVIAVLICLTASITLLLHKSTSGPTGPEPSTAAGMVHKMFFQINFDIDHELGIIFTSICCVYSLFLIMLGFTSKKLVKDIQFDQDTVPLADIKYDEIK